MKPYAEMSYHPVSEELTQILCDKTQNPNPLFFRVMVAYYFSLVASMMRCKIDCMDRKELPVNLYAINLATSGAGKGHSTNIMEDEIINQFRDNFVESTMPLQAAISLPLLAVERGARNSTDPDVELAKAQLEYEAVGPVYFSFDSGTAPAIKDVRHKLLMAQAGALNLQIDEAGTNLTGVMEILSPYLEMFDVGKIKQKLTKNTAENKRREEIHGRVPANLMMYGTPSRLLNGGKTEEEFYNLLDTGYARRCFFGYSRSHEKPAEMTATELLARRRCTKANSFITDLSDRLGNLADISFMGKSLQVSEPVTLIFLEYELALQSQAFSLKEHDEIRKAEILHRAFKALKLAGAYTFIDGGNEITENHAYYAIKLAEDSGMAFEKLLARDRPHVKLAKYLSDIGRNVTQSDLIEDLPFYRGAANQKAEMLQHAVAWGYQNNIIIKKLFQDGIEFLRGETLKETDLSHLMVSYSNDFAQGYVEDSAAFTDLYKMTQANGIHWCTHYFKDGHRTEENAIPGFNLVVLDVDKDLSLSTAKMLLKDYKAMFYTTKRSTEAENRFRIILPTNYELHLDAKDYKEFMNNLYQWLPFAVDDTTGQRSRKWQSHPGHYEYQDGQLLDVLPFIPKTSKNETLKTVFQGQKSMDNLERWILNNSGEGNRNQMLLRYAMILVDADLNFESVRSRVIHLNEKMPDKLDEIEIMGTIMVTAAKAIAARP